MRRAGIEIVRIAEFAWQKMEPSLGEFHWDWLDQAIEVLAVEGLNIILGTPTAAPPAWITYQNPGILPVDIEGRRRKHGSRRHYCPGNPDYMNHCKRIVQVMAERYANNQNVVGWQIDNEFGDHDTARCYCDGCTARFRSWLEKKYQSIDGLNESWGTDFWSQKYRNWDEIGLPNLTITAPNPSQTLDFYRFSSETYISFLLAQIDILRAINPEVQINTNFLGSFQDLNYHDLAKPLDLVTWDSYPTGYTEVHGHRHYSPEEVRPQFPCDTGDPYVVGMCHDIMYGLREEPFWIMEQQVGNINWSAYNQGIGSGTLRLWTWHAIGSGADAVIYFRWRAVLNAQEQFHSGLLKHDGSPAIGYLELMKMQSEKMLMGQVTAAPRTNQVALLLDYEDLWSIQIQPHRSENALLRHLFVYYRAFQKLGIPVSIVSSAANLDQYKLVVAPAMILGGEDRSKKLAGYVEAGGFLVTGVGAGFKTPSNKFTDQPLPGVFREIAGIEVLDWHAISIGIEYPFSSEIPGLQGAAGIWAESLGVDSARQEREVEILARYSGGVFKGQAALTRRILVGGKVYYIGWYPTVDQATALVSFLSEETDLKRQELLPHGMVISYRSGYTILMNFSDADLITSYGGKQISLEPRDVVVVPSN